MTNIRILVDSRETRSPVRDFLLRTPRAEIELVELEVGDYVIAEGAAIERKTADDLVVSIMDGRFIGQLELMRSAYVKPFLLVEGDPYKVRSKILPAAITGALSHAAVNCGVSVIPTPSPERSAEMIFTMARHVTEGLGYLPALRGGKPKDAALLSLYLLEGLPGVGHATAIALLKHFGSAHAVFTASVADLCATDGIGEKTAKRIVEALTASSVDLRT